jgi:hypothetical protein
MSLRTLQANCQVAVSLSLANDAASLPVVTSGANLTQKQRHEFA